MRFFLILGALSLVPLSADAQSRTGWVFQTEAELSVQGDSDLSTAGEMSQTEAEIGFGGLYLSDSGTAAGLSLSFNQRNYDFSSTAPQLWGDVQEISVSAPLRFSISQTGQLFVAPTMRWSYEDGASKSDSVTYGAFLGLSWQVSDTLRIGPALGAFSEIEGSDINVIPAFVMDWDIAPRWNLSSNGPGLALSYDYSDALSVSLGVEYDSREFRLDNTGLAPGGVGEDTGIPVTLSLGYQPNPGLALDAFVGAKVNGELTVDDNTGARISRESYDTAPIAGVSLRLRF